MASHENKTAKIRPGSNEDAEDEFSSLYVSIREPLSILCETSRPSMSSSFLTVQDSHSEDVNVYSEIADEDVKDETYHLHLIGEVNKTEVNISKENIAEQFLNCEKADAEDDFSKVYASIRGPLPSVCETSRRSISSSFLTVKGSHSEDVNVYSEIADEDVKNETYHLPCIGEVNKTEVNISKENMAEQCSKCEKADATHFCRSCRHGRQYMCYVCLKDHNHWHDDHDVVTLSVKSEGNLELPAKDLNKTGTSKEEDLRQLKMVAFSKLPSKVDKNGDQNKKKNIVRDISTRSTEINESHKPLNQGGQVISKKFNKDEFYPSGAHELKTKQRCKSDGQLQKDGIYSIRSSSDTKTCAITGIVQLKNKKVLLADSKNSNLKILNEETFKIIGSHALPSSPYLMCYVKENRVIIACINYEFYLVDFNGEIDIQLLFEIKHLFKGIAFAKQKLFGCTSDTVEVFSSSGKQISKLKPVDVTNIEDMCVSKEGDIIYCADEKKGLVVLDKHGTVVYIISENLCQPYRLCHGQRGYIFVTETNSDRVMRFDIHRKDVRQIGKDDIFIYSHISLCHEMRNNRLIVAVWQSDKIHVYTSM